MPATLAHLVAVVVLPPLLQGVITRTKSWFSGRTGPSVLQPYRDLWKLFRKGATLSPTTTAVFRGGPAASLAAVLAAALLVPLSSWGAPLAFPGDLVVFAYTLGLARFVTVLAALDTGSSFEGMGASREAAFSSLAEPALFLCLAVLVRTTGELSLSAIFGPALSAAWSRHAVALGLSVAALFLIFLAENCRIPVDDPTTHLELTMIHEVMVLDHSGPDFGVILYGAALKMVVLGSLLVDLLLPVAGMGAWGRLGLQVAALLALAVAVGAVESTMARLRLARVPLFLAAALVLPAFGLALTFA